MPKRQPTDLKTVMEQYNSSMNGAKHSKMEQKDKALPNPTSVKERKRTKNTTSNQTFEHIDSSRHKSTTSTNRLQPKSDRPPIRQKVTQTDYTNHSRQSPFVPSTLKSSNIDNRLKTIQTQRTKQHDESCHRKQLHSPSKHASKSFSTNPNDYVNSYTNIARRVPSSPSRGSSPVTYSKKLESTRLSHPRDSFPEAGRWRKFSFLYRKYRNSTGKSPKGDRTIEEKNNMTAKKSFSTNFRYNKSSPRGAKSKRKRLKAFLSRVWKK